MNPDGQAAVQKLRWETQLADTPCHVGWLTLLTLEVY